MRTKSALSVCRFCFALVVAWPAGFLIANPVFASGPNEAPVAAIAAPKSETITPDVIESRRKGVEHAKDLDEAARAKGLDFYRQAAAAAAANTAAYVKAELKRLRDPVEAGKLERDLNNQAAMELGRSLKETK